MTAAHGYVGAGARFSTSAWLHRAPFRLASAPAVSGATRKQTASPGVAERMTAEDLAEIRAALTRDRTVAIDRLATLERELSGLVEAADTANIDDEHDPEGATTAFERAQVISLMEQARRQ